MSTCTVTSCTREAEPGYARCRTCRLHIRECARKLRAQRVKKRLCPRDGRPASAPSKYCATCLAYFVTRQKRLINERKQNKRCVDCGSPELEPINRGGTRTSIRCEKCNRIRRKGFDRKRVGSGKTNAMYVAEYRKRMRAKGRCILCGDKAAVTPRGRSVMCEFHLMKATASSWLRRNKTKTKAAKKNKPLTLPPTEVTTEAALEVTAEVTRTGNSS